MEIQNSTSKTVSWFCFNHLDALKVIALASGDLSKDEKKVYDAPDNVEGFYCVRFTYKGGGTELASGTVRRTDLIRLILKDEGTYSVLINPKDQKMTGPITPPGTIMGGGSTTGGLGPK